MNTLTDPLRRAGWHPRTCHALMDELWNLRRSMQHTESAWAARIRNVSPDFRASARNLAHYLALREQDRRELQDRLAAAGLSSLGRAESHVMANVDKVLGLLHRLAGQNWVDLSEQEPVGLHSGRAQLEKHTEALLGRMPGERVVRIMVTLPSEAADDATLVDELVAAGMNVARINCAHDDAVRWEAMARHVRESARARGCEVKVLMDLGGPKLRTGPVSNGPSVLKVKPRRDVLGRVVRPARLGLRAAGSVGAVPGADLHVGVATDWLTALRVGDEVTLTDARGSRRALPVVVTGPQGALVEVDHTAYLVPETRLERLPSDNAASTATAVTPLFDLPPRSGHVFLRRGDRLRFTCSGVAPALDRHDGVEAEMPWIACTLPEVFTQVRPGERVGLDDGRMSAVVVSSDADEMVVEITQAPLDGASLAADKGINLPDSRLCLPALTAQDIDDLRTVARVADLVGLSFVQSGRDVDDLRAQLKALGAEHLGVILKIETRRAFENLPELLFAAMACPAAGVMIARGDLAVECGYERLAEVQEELLWAAEAAHMPVIWATQVLETLAKTGQPSRAEITDAAMGERAECVMLNKGPHIVQAMHTLDDILCRMQHHQHKKRPLLRALRAWRPEMPAGAADHRRR